MSKGERTAGRVAGWLVVGRAGSLFNVDRLTVKTNVSASAAALPPSKPPLGGNGPWPPIGGFNGGRAAAEADDLFTTTYQLQPRLCRHQSRRKAAKERLAKFSSSAGEEVE